MEYNVWSCLFFGLISGLSEFLPVSTLAHQYLYSYITGFSGNNPWIRLMVYLGCLAAVIACCWRRLVHISRELRLSALPKRRRNRVLDNRAIADFKLARIALLPMILAMLLSQLAMDRLGNLPMMSLMLILSGIFIYLPLHMKSGFRNSEDLTPLDGLLLGFVSSLAVIPGLSRMGLTLFAGRRRFCSREAMMDLALVIAIPMLVCLCVYHFVLVLISGAALFYSGAWLVGFVASAAAFGGAVAAIYLMRFLTVKLDFGGFAFYCWGLAVFSFVYYLIA